MSLSEYIASLFGEEAGALLEEEPAFIGPLFEEGDAE